MYHSNHLVRRALAAGLLVVAAGLARAQELPQGVAAGDVSQDSGVLWARSTVAGDVTFDLATDPGFGSLLLTQSVAVADPAIPAKLDLGVAALNADTQYFYRATSPGGSVATGTFRTAADLGTFTGLRFGVSGDWRGELSPYSAVSNVPARGLDFFLLHGDTIYADYPSDAVPAAQATTIGEYRLKHAEVYSDYRGSGLNGLGALRASTAVFATIDDHEVTNDFSGGADVATDPRFTDPAGTLINDAVLYETGMQAFQEYNPIRDQFYGSLPADPRTSGERQLYRNQNYGSDAVFITTDARSFRDPGLPGIANPLNPAEVGAFIGASLTLDRTMLGRTQLDQLKADLLQAQNDGVTWKFVAIPEPIQNLGPVGASDRYEGYARERNEILQFIDANGIKNVVFVAADVHGTTVNNLTYSLDGVNQIATSAFEVTTGAVAFEEPFGPTVMDIALAAGLVTPEQFGFYDLVLPVAPDTDSVVNDKDDFVKVTADLLLAGLGYDPIGLNNNLPQANDPSVAIDATLLAGDYMALHTFGWTEFDIDSLTGTLTVTTYGVPAYTEADAIADPAAIAALVPVIVSQFVVNPMPVPEPASALTALAAALGVIAARRRRT